jgi:hypothetical protein
MRRKLVLFTSLVLLFVLPMIGGFYKWKDLPGGTTPIINRKGDTTGTYFQWKGMPPGYGEFPAQKVSEDAPFNETYFIVASIICLFILVFFLFPGWFGFKKPPVKTSKNRVMAAYPPWFVPSIVVLCVSWFFMWGRFEVLRPIDYFTFVPLWWGFIFLLDAIVYKRNGGVSLVSSCRNTMKIMAVTSAASWFVFEFLNFFVLENWYYPNNHIFSNFGNISWQLLSYTTVLPALFEWYWFLRTFDSLRHRYSYGPQINFSRGVQYFLLALGLSLSFFMAIYPDQLFWALWLGLIPALVPAMTLSKYWNPFTPIGTRGDWSPMLLIALSTLFNGFLWELWNFGSQWIHSDPPTNPNFWKYSVPYLDKFHIFSEMPVLGYFGYLFFGVGCWVLWGTVAHLVGFDPAIHDHDKTEEVSRVTKVVSNQTEIKATNETEITA